MCSNSNQLDVLEFYHLFQPIYHLKNLEILGYEAFLRSTACRNPEEIFNEATRQNLLYETDLSSLNGVFEHINFVTDNEVLLFLNIYPSTIIDERFPEYIRQAIERFNIPKHRVVFEINESPAEEDLLFTATFKERLHFLKEQGFYYALDDIGKWDVSLKKLEELKPNFVKLDQCMMKEKHKQDVVSVFTDYCKRNDIRLILEGIEKKEDLHLAQSKQIVFGQGYLLGRPNKNSSLNWFI
ncbi:EAL domain-containing protein [Bacillus timonensis]|nr:EAL domain-containing protein [Bacillus timonensis]